jgi:hypothetical protein
VPTRKQRRRRAKDRRHEWEYVYVDDEGHEVEVEEDEVAPAKAEKQPAKASTRAAAGNQQSRRAGRKVDPPSWQKVFRRAAMFAPIMLVVIYLLKPDNVSAAGIVIQLAVLLVFFIPFSYMMDTLMYRAYRKRIGDPIKPTPRKR